jgi:hypothetical protein
VLTVSSSAPHTRCCPAIRRLRDDAEAIRQQTIEQPERMLASGRDTVR